MSRKGKVFKLADVAPHNQAKDCWLIIGGKVYDVTKFLEEHPGGPEVLISVTGKDATDDFEDIGHSSTAVDMLKGMYVGDIDMSTVPKKTKYTVPKQPFYNQDKTMQFVNRILQFLLPVFLLGLAVGVRIYSSKSA